MAYVLEVALTDKQDDRIKLIYSFYGMSEVEVQTYFREHQGYDEYLAAAVREGRVDEDLEEIDDDELPDVDDDEEDDDED